MFVKYVRAFFVLSILMIGSGNLFAQETTNEDTTATMDKEGGLNYAPAYFYYLNTSIAKCKDLQLIDTSVLNAYCEDISLNSHHLYATLGCFGQAQKAMNFNFSRKHGFHYKQLPYDSYLRTFENWKIYSLPTVYTNLSYDFVSGKENHFSATHAQHIYEGLTLNAGLETILAEGRYVNQALRDVNVGVGLDYVMPNRRYGIKLYYSFTMMKLGENGGILYDTAFAAKKNVRLLDVHFTTAENNTMDNHIFLRHYLSISPNAKEDKRKVNVGYIVHDLDYHATRYIFHDDELSATDFYDYHLFNNDTTYTRIRFRQLKNSVYWSSYMPEDTIIEKPYFLHLAAGVNHSLNMVYDTTGRFLDNQFTPFATIQTRLFGRLEIAADAYFTINGYNAGDVTVEGNVCLDIGKQHTWQHTIETDVKFYNFSPDYIFSHYLSNNYLWNNHLKKQQNFFVDVKWKYLSYEISANYYMLNHYTVFQEKSNVMQMDKLTNVYQLAAYIPFTIKGFGWTANMYLQYCDNKQLHIPVFATRQTMFYGFYFCKKKLEEKLFVVLGLDFLYNTSYYADAYNPALQQFYLQSDTKVGNYGYLDVFLKAKINRFVLQAKWTHAWAGLFGRNYYFTPHYPSKDMGFAVGIAWRFHD